MSCLLLFPPIYLQETLSSFYKNHVTSKISIFQKKLLPHQLKNHVSRLLYQSLLVSAIEEDNFLLNTTSCSCRKPSGCILFCYSNIWFYTELHFVYFGPFSTSTECLCPKPCYQFSTRGCLKAKITVSTFILLVKKQTIRIWSNIL